MGGLEPREAAQVENLCYEKMTQVNPSYALRNRFSDFWAVYRS